MTVDLPIEILYDILLRLDVRKLCKFRCVSKSWNVSISDPSFVHSHTQRSMKKHHLLLNERGRKLLNNPTGPLDIDSLKRLMHYDDEPFCGTKPQLPKYWRLLTSIRPFNQDKFSLTGSGGFMIRQHQDPYDVEHGGFRIISSCGGLVLLSRYFHGTKLCLMNPVTSRINELPEPDANDGFHDGSYYLLYLKSAMEFKVVRLFPAGDGDGCDVLVLNDSPKWTRLHDVNFPSTWYNGTTAGGSLFLQSTEGLILEFEGESNKISSVNNPPVWVDSPGDFIEINGELGVVDWNNTRQREVTEIWVLKDKKISLWMMAYSIKIRVHPNGCLRSPIHFVDEDTWFIEYNGSICMCYKTGGNLQEIVTRYERLYCFYWENLSLL